MARGSRPTQAMNCASNLDGASCVACAETQPASQRWYRGRFGESTRSTSTQVLWKFIAALADRTVAIIKPASTACFMSGNRTSISFGQQRKPSSRCAAGGDRSRSRTGSFTSLVSCTALLWWSANSLLLLPISRSFAMTSRPTIRIFMRCSGYLESCSASNRPHAVAVALQPQPVAVVFHFVEPVRGVGDGSGFGGEAEVE